MELLLTVSQGAGLAVATGVRPYLPPLLAGALARANLGLDFDGTDYAFLESVPFLGFMVALTAAGTLGSRALARRLAAPLVALAAVVLGALLFAASLAGEGYAWWPGIAAGAAVAGLARGATATLLAGAAARLASRVEQPVATLDVYADLASLGVAGAAVLAPPLSYLPLALCVWILAGHRRRAGRKYEGLRVLR